MRKLGTVGLLAVVLAVTGCSSGGSGDTSGAISGDITVLTQRTDIVDTVFADYKKKFVSA